jgi:hypothetical protein
MTLMAAAGRGEAKPGLVSGRTYTVTHDLSLDRAAFCPVQNITFKRALMDGFDGEIDAVIKASPLCARIMEFLIDHEGAMDTVKGAAMCWVDGDEVEVKHALESLVSIGLVAVRPFGTRLYYGLTPNPRVRKWLHENRSRFSVGARDVQAARE